LNKDGNLGFQDFIIDKISGKQPVQKSSLTQKPIPVDSIIPKENKPHTDVLANIVSEPQPFSIPDTKTIVSPEEVYVPPTESTIPDWLKESTSLQSSLAPSETTIKDSISIPENIMSEENIDTSTESSMPDWLKGA
jgi:hypothetical protein